MYYIYSSTNDQNTIKNSINETINEIINPPINEPTNQFIKNETEKFSVTSLEKKNNMNSKKSNISLTMAPIIPERTNNNSNNSIKNKKAAINKSQLKHINLEKNQYENENENENQNQNKKKRKKLDEHELKSLNKNPKKTLRYKDINTKKLNTNIIRKKKKKNQQQFNKITKLTKTKKPILKKLSNKEITKKGRYPIRNRNRNKNRKRKPGLQVLSQISKNIDKNNRTINRKKPKKRLNLKSIKEIKTQQNSTKGNISFRGFNKNVHDILKKEKPGYKIQKAAVLLLKTTAEDYLTNIFQLANILRVKYKGKPTIYPIDIKTIFEMKKNDCYSGNILN